MSTIRSFDCSDNGCIARVPCAEDERCKRAMATMAASIETNRKPHNTEAEYRFAFDESFEKHWRAANELQYPKGSDKEKT